MCLNTFFMTQKTYIQLKTYVKGPPEYQYCTVTISSERNLSFLVLELKNGMQWILCF